MKMTIEFNLVLGVQLDALAQPRPRAGIPLPPPPPPPPPGEERQLLRIPQKILLEKQDGTVTGRYYHPHWGWAPATDVSWSDNHVAFTAPSGHDDKGGETAFFNFCFVVTDASDDVWGFAGGKAPFFRSFLPAEGTIISRE